METLEILDKGEGRSHTALLATAQPQKDSHFVACLDPFLPEDGLPSLSSITVTL